jgi:hypothetical protein
MPIYYHETIDASIVREKALAYLDKVGRAVTERTNVPGSQMRNLGKWVVNWTTGRWIQVVGQWEMTSWDWFIEHFTKTNLMFDHPEGQEQYRSGGFDRLLKPWEGTPTLDQIVQEGRRAPFVLQETISVPAGSAPAYLESLRSAAPAIGGSGRGMQLHGAYEVLLRDESEVLVQWAFADLSSFTGAIGDTRGFSELAAWREQARATERTYVAALLEPTEWSPLR